METPMENKQIRGRLPYDNHRYVLDANGNRIPKPSGATNTNVHTHASDMPPSQLEKHILADIQIYLNKKPDQMMHLLQQLKAIILNEQQKQTNSERFALEKQKKQTIGQSGALERKNKKKPKISLASVLTKTCKKWVGQFDNRFHYVKLQNAFDYMHYHKLRYTISDGALLAVERFNLFASPWDDDIDTTVPLDEAERVFQVREVPGKYTDVSRSKAGVAIYRKYCRGIAHANVCFKVRIIRLEETAKNGGSPDCISFEALNWGFLHVRYHNGCEASGQKIFDIFIHYKCLNDESKNCQQASEDYYDYITQLTNVLPGKRFGGGFRPEWFDILVDVEHGFKLEKTVISGVETYIPPKARTVKYLDGIYPNWDKKVLICPHDLFRAFNVCNEKEGDYRPEYGYKEALDIMYTVSDCKKVLGKGKLTKLTDPIVIEDRKRAISYHHAEKNKNKLPRSQFDVVTYPKYKLREVVEGNCCNWGKYYKGVVVKVNGDDTYWIQFEDGDQRPRFEAMFMRKLENTITLKNTGTPKVENTNKETTKAAIEDIHTIGVEKKKTGVVYAVGDGASLTNGGTKVKNLNKSTNKAATKATSIGGRIKKPSAVGSDAKKKTKKRIKRTSFNWNAKVP